MKTSRTYGLFCGLLGVWLLISTLWGCAHHDPKNSYEKLLETQMERDKAIARTEKVSPEKLPKMTDADHERSGDAHFQQGKLGRAYVQYTKALHLNPKNTRVRYKMGLLFLTKGLNEEAIKEFQVVLEKEPDHALAHEAMGLAWFQARQPEAAERNLQQALALDSKLWKAHTFLGIIYNHRNLPDVAIREHKAAIGLAPSKKILYNNLGISYALMGEYDNALKAFETALRGGGSNARVYNNLGLVLSRLGRYEEALEAFRRGGNAAQAYNNLGCVYLHQGDYDKAIWSLEKAMEIAPTFYTTASENLKKARSDFFSGPSFDSKIQNEPSALLSTEEIGKGTESMDSHRYGTHSRRKPRAGAASPQSRNFEQTPREVGVREGRDIRVELSRTDAEKEPKNDNAQSDQTLNVSPETSKSKSEETTTPATAPEKPEMEAVSVLSTLEAETPVENRLEKGKVVEIEKGDEAFKPNSPSTGRYTVHIATFRERASANQFLDELRKQGLEAFRWEVYRPETGKWHRACVGNLPTFTQAHLLAKRLEQKGFKTSVAKLPGTRKQSQSD